MHPDLLSNRGLARADRGWFLAKTGFLVLVASFGAATLRAVPENLALGLKEMATDYRAARTDGAKTLAHARFSKLATDYPGARTDAQDRVQVEVALDGTRSLEDTVAAFQAQGCEITARVPWYHQGLLSMWIPLDKAPKIGRTAGVDSVRLSLQPMHHAGKVAGQGAKVLNALTAQTRYNTFGAGVSVGVLSDSYNLLPSSYPVHAAQDVASGDLPGVGNPEGYTTPVTVMQDAVTSFDEGRAMLQIIHDVAPAAREYFATAEASEAGFASNITALAAAGCNVICDDVSYYDEPMFSDGVVAQAVDKATAAGATYFSAAGNDGNDGYSATFNGVANDAAAQALLLSEGGITYGAIPAAETAVISKFHRFGTNPDGTPILVQKVRLTNTNGVGNTGTIIFQWDDPNSVSVNGVKQITTDYDLLVFAFNPNGTFAYAASKSGTASNFSTNLPVELPSSVLTADFQYEFVIVLTNRADPNVGGPARDQATHVRWAVQTNSSQLNADFVGPNSVDSFGHSCAATCAGTAAYVYDTGYLAANPLYAPAVEPYSSNGPVTIYFDSAGNRLATPVTRKQPLLSAVDGIDTTFFPPEINVPAPGPANPSTLDTDGDGYPNFNGTSAAAPHAAGCAALILSAAAANGIALTPADVRSLLTSTTQGQSDQDPTVSNATAGAAKFSARDRHTYSDPQAFTITYNGAAGTTLNTLRFDLSPVPGNFAPATYAVTTGAAASGTPGGLAPAITASKVTAADGVSAGTTTLTLTLANFVPGSTLSFGVAQTVAVAGGNHYSHGDQLAGATVTTTDSSGITASGTLANTYSKKWNYKSGYGLVDVNAAIFRLLGR